MPELPEIETLKRALEPAVTGKIISQAWQSHLPLRINVLNAAINLANWRVMEVARRGKNILWRLKSTGGETQNNKENWLLIHLGMSGRLLWYDANSKRQLHDHWQLNFANEEKVLRYNDPRRFGGWMTSSTLNEMEEKLALGLEPLPNILAPSIVKLLALAPKFNGNTLHTKTRSSSQAIKVWLMNGQKIAGVGNIYASEALYLAEVHPARSANSLRPKECARIVDGIQTILSAAVKAGGSTLRDFRQMDGDTGYFQFNFSVYDRAGEHCKTCFSKSSKKQNTLIQKIVQGGRSTYFCQTCQK